MHIWQPEIEDDQVGVVNRRRLEAHGSVFRLADRKALKFESGTNETADVRFIVDHQDRRMGLIHCQSQLPPARLAVPRARGWTQWFPARGPRSRLAGCRHSLR